MLITPNFKKSLIVEQFQGNYLKSKNATFFYERSSNGLNKNTNHKIKNISGNISLTCIPFKLGTDNVRQVKYKMTPPLMLPWQQSRLQALFSKNQISPFLTR